jgi:hypothetical protein
MAPVIRISSLDAIEADRLADALAVRGLVARVSGCGDAQSVEIHHHHEELRDMLPDLISALESWLADGGREQLTLTVGHDDLSVGLKDDLRAVLQARIAEARRHARR